MAEIDLDQIDEMDIVVLPSDKITKVPYGIDGKTKITIAQMIQTKEFKSLEPTFARRILQMIRDNPTFGILQGGAGRDEEAVRSGFYFNYRIMSDQKDYENIPKYYPKIKNGQIKWNPEDKQWYKRVTERTVAVPGGSWHTGGYAVDFTGDTRTAGLVSEKYGIKQILGTGEQHHFQPLGLPTSKRMFQYLMERYGLDPIKNPLPNELIEWIDSEVASNVPRQPTRILSQLDPRIAAYKKSIAPKPIDILADALKPKKVNPYNFGVDPLPAETPTTTGAPATTTTRPATTTTSTTTTLPATTTTARPTTTTTTEPTQVGGQRSLAPSAAEYGQRVSPATTTTTTAPKATTTSTTVVPKTTSSTTTTTLPIATKTTMAPKPKNETSPDTTIPGQVATDDIVITPGGGTGYAGGIDPNYKPPTKAQFLDPNKPYVYKSQDWQILLTMPQADVISIQRNLMKAFPGFKPGQLGNRYDPKTIKYFKSALGRINQFSSDATDALGVGIRGKSTVDAVAAIAKIPMVAGSDESTSGPQPYRLTSPTDLKAIFRKASQDALGRSLGEGDLNRMVAAYQSNELKYQKTYAAGGTATQQADPTTFAQSQIEKDFSGEVNVNKLDDIFSAIDNALSGGRQ